MYVRIGTLSPVFLTPGTKQTMNGRSHRSNTAAHSPRVCDTPMMRSIAVARCVSRNLPSVFHPLPFQVPCFVSYIFTYNPWLEDLYRHHLSPWCFFCRYVLLCVIQQRHSSTCARHSAPTDVGSILYACTLSTTVMSVVVIGIGLCTYLPAAAVCNRHFLLHADPWILDRVYSSRQVPSTGRSIMHSSIRTKILTAGVIDSCVSCVLLSDRCYNQLKEHSSTRSFVAVRVSSAAVSYSMAFYSSTAVHVL